MSKWDKRIQKAEKYLQPAQEHGRKVYSRYKDDRAGDDIGAQSVKRVNLFHANVNTLKESLFNSLPKPDVSRLHKGDTDDDVARVAALIMQRALHYEVTCMDDFSAAVKGAILDRLVPGIGQVWLTYEEDESITIESVYWEDFIYAPTRSWQKMPWAGRKLELTKAEVVERWGEDALAKIQAPKNPSLSNLTPKEILEDKYCVYEIWSRTDRKVYHISVGLDEPLDVKDDPYELRGFFPFPCPLIANPTTTSFLPVTDYHLAQDQYIQLDILYARISLIIEAIKVAGVYDASETSIGNMLEGQENKLVPVENWAMYAEKGGAKGMIDWYPVEQVVTVLQSLQQQFEAIKALLQEVTGMSDIVRGASNQYETAKAQQIKAQFASVRMNGYQRDVAEFVRSILRIMADMMGNLYSDEKYLKIIGNISEADAQFLAPAGQVVRDNFLMHYKVDISADSLTQADWALEKDQRMELTGYISQFLQAAVPAVEANPELGTLLMGMLKFTISGYKGASELEGLIDQQVDQMVKAAQNPKPKEPSPEEIKAQAEQQKMQAEFQMKQQEMAAMFQMKQKESENNMVLEQQQAQADMAVEREKIQLQAQLQTQKMEGDLLMQQQELAFLREKYAMEMEFKREEHTLKMQSAVGQAAIKQESAEKSAELKAKEQTSAKSSKP